MVIKRDGFERNKQGNYLFLGRKGPENVVKIESLHKNGRESFIKYFFCLIGQCKYNLVRKQLKKKFKEDKIYQKFGHLKNSEFFFGQKDRPTDRQADRQTYRQTDRQTDIVVHREVTLPKNSSSLSDWLPRTEDTLNTRLF